MLLKRKRTANGAGSEMLPVTRKFKNRQSLIYFYFGGLWDMFFKMPCFGLFFSQIQ